MPVNRRQCLYGMGLTGLALLAGCQPLFPAPRTSPARLGYVGLAREPAPRFEAFRQGLRDDGWVEGENLLIESRYAENEPDQLRALVTELALLPVDILVALNYPCAAAA